MLAGVRTRVLLEPVTVLSANAYHTATGIGLIWADTLPYDDYVPSVRWGNSYYSIALSLNVVLTLMIITRLVLHNRNIRKAIGTLDRVSGLYSTITAMLVESGVLYAVSFLLLVGPWASRSIVELITFQILPEVQVRTVTPPP